MKLRHAVALALVGWYLMCPPIRPGCSPSEMKLRSLLGKSPCAARTPDYEAPIDQWQTVLAEFDSILKCQTGEQTSQDGCECVATDDPRLKGK